MNLALLTALHLTKAAGYCLIFAAALVFAARQLYPVPWVFVFSTQYALYMVWLSHNLHRNRIALSLALMGLEEDYCR